MSHATLFEKLASEAKSHVKEVSPLEAHEQQAAGAVLIDVRETEEYGNGHAEGATHISRGVLELKIENTVPDTETPIICYCGGGFRSALAAESLQRMGYKNVASMADGFRGWRQQGLPAA